MYSIKKMKINFILSHIPGRTYSMLSMMASIVAQTNPNWTIHVVCDGIVDITYIQTVFSQFDNIKYSTIERETNTYTHNLSSIPKNYGLSTCTDEWLVFGADDNYYVPIFVDEMLKIINNNPKINFIYFDMIHNYFNYTLFKCKPLSHQIDMGSMVVRTDLAKTLPLDITLGDADGIFAEQYVSTYCKLKENIHYAEHVYFIHN
jgi:hypothetical protein